MREAVLKLLLEHINHTVSGEDMSRQLGITRAAVWKHIKALREKGYRIDAATGGGYVLQGVPDGLESALVEYYRRHDWPVRIEDTVASTNKDALAWAESGAPNGALLIARQQSGGRGRRGRVWMSPEGGLWMSSILRTSLSPQHVQPYALLAAAATCQTLEQLFPALKPKIKWPNDIHINGKKLCGILTELSLDIDRVKYIIVGMGMNANFSYDVLDSELRDIATTLQAEGVHVNLAELAAGINDRLLELSEQYEKEASFAFLMDYYQGRLAWMGKEVRILGGKQEKQGIIKGIDESGALLLQSNGLTIPIISGEISVRRTSHV